MATPPAAPRGLVLPLATPPGECPVLTTPLAPSGFSQALRGRTRRLDPIAFQRAGGLALLCSPIGGHGPPLPPRRLHQSRGRGLFPFSAPGSPGTGSEGADPAGGCGCGGTCVGTLAFPSGHFCVLRGVRPCVCSTARAGSAGGVVQPGWWSLGAGARAEPRLGEGRLWVRRQCGLCSGAARRGRGRAQGAGPAGPGARLLGNRKEMQVVATGSPFPEPPRLLGNAARFSSVRGNQIVQAQEGCSLLN